MITKLWIMLITVLALILFAVVLYGIGVMMMPATLSHASDEAARGPHTLMFSNYAFAFKDYEQMPLSIIEPVCWNDMQDTFCDSRMDHRADSFRLFLYLNWETQRVGEIYLLGDECYLQTYFPEMGADGQPHIAEIYWINCIYTLP